MFDGNMFRVAIGTPMRMIARANNSLADAEPEPFTLANLTTKSLTDLIALDMATGLRGIKQEFLHVPSARGAAFGAKTAVQADVFVFHHHSSGLQFGRDIEVLRLPMQRRRGQPLPQLGFRPILGETDAVHRANINASVAFDALWRFEDRLHVTVQAAFGFEESLLEVETEFDLHAHVSGRHLGRSVGDLVAPVE